MVLTDKRALVTGTSRGIGRAIAIELARQGAQMALCYGRDIEGARETAERCARFGRQPSLHSLDISKSEEVKALAEAVGKVDILVNNAGITADKLIGMMAEEDFDRVLSVNLKGAFLMTRHFSRPMVRARSGRIINITSVIGLMGNAGQSNYAAAKAGLIGFTKSAAREFASRGITVNAVAPGFIDTDMTRAMSESAREKILSGVPLGRMGTPEDVAALCGFLASDAAGYITGQVISVDGGLLMQ